MKTKTLTPKQIGELVTAVAAGSNIQQAAMSIGLPPRSRLVRLTVAQLRKENKIPPPDKRNNKFDKRKESGEERGFGGGVEIDDVTNSEGLRTVSWTGGRIVSVDDLVNTLGIDLSRWRIIRQEVKSNEGYRRAQRKNLTFENGSMSGFVKDTGKLLIEPLFSVRIVLEPIHEANVWYELRSEALELIKRQAPLPKKPPLFARGKERFLFGIGIPDLHVGKRGWGEETRGEDWSVSKALKIFSASVRGLLAHAKGAEKILLPIGNDLIHIEAGRKAETSKGTPQDASQRYYAILKWVRDAIYAAVDECLEVAPVDIVIVPGNHAREAETHLGLILEAYYGRHPQVRVDARPTFRKYYRYGQTLIGMTHGDEEKLAELPMIMVNEATKDFSDTTHREWWLGHFHRKSETVYRPLTENGGVRLRVLPALCSEDAWHSMRGYISPIRAAEGYRYDFKSGYAGHHSVQPKI